MLIPSARKSRPCCWPPRPQPAGLELTCRTSPAVPSLLPTQRDTAPPPSRGLSVRNVVPETIQRVGLHPGPTVRFALPPVLSVDTPDAAAPPGPVGDSAAGCAR